MTWIYRKVNISSCIKKNKIMNWKLIRDYIILAPKWSFKIIVYSKHFFCYEESHLFHIDAALFDLFFYRFLFVWVSIILSLELLLLYNNKFCFLLLLCLLSQFVNYTSLNAQTLVTWIWLYSAFLIKWFYLEFNHNEQIKQFQWNILLLYLNYYYSCN